MILAHSDPVTHAALLTAGIASIVVYAVGWWRRPRARVAPLAAWTLGVLSVLVALAPPFERIADSTFTGHMVQHLVLLVISAPMLVAGAPGALRRVGHRGRRRPGAGERAAIRSAAPLVAAAAFVLVLGLTHLTPIYDAALRHRSVHDLEHAAYLSAAVALWAALRGGRRVDASRRIGAVFAVIAGTALVGVVLLTADTALIATYRERLGADDALADQRAAAALMWVSAMAVTLPLLVVTVWRWAAAEQRAAARQERLLETT
jgi:cytochrome c oxidase assembly factor CtaG